MPSNYKKKTAYIAPEAQTLVTALREIKIGRKSVLSISRTLHIPKTNLYRLVAAFDRKFKSNEIVTEEKLQEFVNLNTYSPGVKTVFTKEQEYQFMMYVLKAVKICYGLSIKELKTMAFQFAKKLKIPYPPAWDNCQIAGKDWYYGFMKRHPNLSLRTPEQIGKARAKAFNKENADGIFVNLGAVLNENSFSRDIIWSMDESGMFHFAPNVEEYWDQMVSPDMIKQEYGIYNFNSHFYTENEYFDAEMIKEDLEDELDAAEFDQDISIASFAEVTSTSVETSLIQSSLNAAGPTQPDWKSMNVHLESENEFNNSKKDSQKFAKKNLFDDDKDACTNNFDNETKNIQTSQNSKRKLEIKIRTQELAEESKENNRIKLEISRNKESACSKDDRLDNKSRAELESTVLALRKENADLRKEVAHYKNIVLAENLSQKLKDFFKSAEKSIHTQNQTVDFHSCSLDQQSK